MNEESRKKRDWVKNAAIVFLTVMLILTFFSNTIMNYSLPEAATQRIQSGTITAKIRGTGTVESGDPYNVEVKESRKVASVGVRVGDKVEAGDVILTLEDEESAELAEAEKTLKTLEDDLDQAMLQGLDAALINKVQSGNTTSVEEFLSQINTLKAAVDAAQSEVDKAQKQYDENAQWQNALNMQISISSAVNVDISKEEKSLNEAETYKTNAELKMQNVKLDTDYDAVSAAYAQAQEELSAANTAYDAAVAAYQRALEESTVSGSNPADLAEAENAKNAAQSRLDTAQSNYNTALSKMNTAQAQVDAAQKEIDKWTKEVNTRQQTLNAAKLKAENAQTESDQVVKNLRSQLAIAEVNTTAAQKTLNDAQKKLTEKTEEYTELISTVIPTEMNLANKMEAIEEQRKTVAKLRSESVGATVTASVAGTITSINVVAGQSTTPGTPVAVIQPEGKGFTLSFSVTNEQAKRVSVGDPAELVNYWWFSDIAAKVASIRPDPSDPSKKKLLTFDLSGDLTAGQSLSLSVGQKSANYDMIVPNSAIREDNNGKFILIVEQKSSPLGNRFKASRVDVEVLASDDTQSAISGGLYGYEDVITTSTKPIEAGQLIRLPD